MNKISYSVPNKSQFLGWLGLVVKNVGSTLVNKNGTFFITVFESLELINLFNFFKNHSNCQYNLLADLCAVDYPFRHNRFGIYYHLLSVRFSARIVVQVHLSSGKALLSLTSLFFSSNWYEREIFDLFGVFFTNHPDLRRLLCDYGFEGYPLRKDFPLNGYNETRFDFIKKRVLCEPLEFAQEHRKFAFSSNKKWFYKKSLLFYVELVCLLMKRWNRKPILVVLSNHLVDYPTPINISFFWSFGSLSGLTLVVQLVSGIFLAMHYTPHVQFAFFSVEHIIRDVNGGWLVRYLHANGASFFFVVVFLHMFRGLYYGSYSHPREFLWCSGVAIFFLMIGTAFIGYVLPWGQISFWGATVITNLVSALPFIGQSIVEWVWGGFSVDSPTLNRFFSLHYILPFVIVALVALHLVLLHEEGSNNPLGLPASQLSISFYPYFYVKDLFAFSCLVFGLCFFVFFYPNALGHSDNYIIANPISTPAHIVPEWYFLPFYAILRSIPNKLGGVIAMAGAIVCLFFLPFLATCEIKTSRFRPLFKKLYWCFIVDCFVLGWVGQNVVEYPFVEIGQLCTLFYFFFLMLLIPVLGRLENYTLRNMVLVDIVQ